MVHLISDPTGKATILKLQNSEYEITITPSPGIFCPRSIFRTLYPLSLIKLIANAYNVVWMLDEISRDEDPLSIENDLYFSLFAYLDSDSFCSKKILDFGCGGGSSTMVISRMFPNSMIWGIELCPTLLELAKARAKFYNREDICFLRNRSNFSLPANLPKFDFILLSAVYEHLLPEERPPILSQLWDLLLPGGILFLNQTPDLRFPIESHTTGLPLINWLPDKIANKIVHTFSKRTIKNESWENLLRAGIRGTTPFQLLQQFKSVSLSPQVKLLNPSRLGITKQSEIWYKAAENRARENWKFPKLQIIKCLKFLLHKLKFPIAPYLNLAFKKN